MAEVKGLRELQLALEQLPGKFQKNVMRGAIRAGSKVIALEAKRLVPVGPPSGEAALYGGREGLLRDSIHVKDPEVKGGRVVGGVVAGGKYKGTKRRSAGDAFYAPFVEYGTAAHLIKAAPNGRLKVHGALVSSVQHPGARPKPFMRPAYENKAQEAFKAVGDYIRKRLATKYGLDVPDEGDT